LQVPQQILQAKHWRAASTRNEMHKYVTSSPAFSFVYSYLLLHFLR
jgi:hypothetical protein